MVARTLFRGALLADVVGRTWRSTDLLVEDGLIAGIGDGLAIDEYTQVIHLDGLVLSPGFIDLHVHLREPGFEYKETIASGTAAAAAGGFTTICSMPNTKPVLDSALELDRLLQRVKQDAVVKVLPIAAISAQSLGQNVVDYRALVAAGACAFSDDGRGVMSSGLMLAALKAGKELNVPIIAHEEDSELACGGNINAGPISALLGDQGIPGVAEYAMVARDIYLAELMGAHLHVAHVSCAETVELIRRAKANGIKVTAEVTPHHLALTEAVVPKLLAQAKVNPPLRSEADRQSVCSGLADGTIDVIATDHAPHALSEKEQPLSQAAFGFSGLETAFAVSYRQMVSTGHMSFIDLLAVMTIKPAEILQLSIGRLAVGCAADLVALDIIEEYCVTPCDLRSRGKNTPFLGEKLIGRAVLTMVDGQIVMDRRSKNAGCGVRRNCL